MFAHDVQVWHMSQATLEDFGRVFFVPFVVEAVRLASTRPDENTICAKESPLREVLRGRAWFGEIDWERAADSFLYVSHQHVSRAASHDGQPLCRKLLLHTLSFVVTAFWLMDKEEQCPSLVLPSSLFLGELIDCVASAVSAMEAAFNQLAGTRVCPQQRQPRVRHHTGSVLADKYRARLPPPNSAVSIANNRTLAVPLPVLDLILLHCIAAGLGPSSSATPPPTHGSAFPNKLASTRTSALVTALIPPRHLYSLVQVCRLFRSRVEPLLRQRLAMFPSELSLPLRSRWVLAVHSEQAGLAELLQLWCKLRSAAVFSARFASCWACGRNYNSVEAVMNMVQQRQRKTRTQGLAGKCWGGVTTSCSVSMRAFSLRSLLISNHCNRRYAC
jgi:hypothetical protein